MNASQGREPARPSQGSGAGGAKTNTAAAQPRLSREAVVAFVLLPVLLAAGFFIGGRLLGEDAPPTTVADGSTDAGDSAEQPDQGAGEPGGDPAVIGPVQPSVEVPEEPTAPSPEPSAAPSPEPAAPSPEPSAEVEPTQAPSPEPSVEPSEAPAPAPAPSAAPPAPAPAPTTAPDGPLPRDPGLLQEVVAGIPQPVAGNGVLLFPGFVSEDVRTWQAQMVERGWDLQVDGIYGERTAEVARDFQVQKGLVVDGLVGPETWSAAWTAPIT